MEIDGVSVLIVMTPIAADNPVEVTKQLCSAKYPVYLVRREADGTIHPVVPGSWPEKLRSKNIAALHWTKVPVRPLD